MILLSQLLHVLLAAFAVTCALAMPTSKEGMSSDIEARGAKYPSAAGRLFNIDGNKEYFSGKPV